MYEDTLMQKKLVVAFFPLYMLVLLMEIDF